MDIFKYINKKQVRENDRVKNFHFQIKKKGKSLTKEERRGLEMVLLKPVPISSYSGKMPGISSFKKCSLLLSFKTEDIILKLKKYIAINNYGGNNTFDIDIFNSLVDRLENKSLIWDKKKRKLLNGE